MPKPDRDAVLQLPGARAGSSEALAPLKGIPTLGTLHCNSNPIADLSPLAGLPLKELIINDITAADLSPLKDLPLLREIGGPSPSERNAAILRAIPTLELINNKPVAQWLKEVENEPGEGVSRSRTP